jgi:hypothetical protein
MKWWVPSILVLIFFSGFIISELFVTTNLSKDIITGIIGGIIACFISFGTKNTKFEYVVNGYILATTFTIWGYMVGDPFVFFITLAVYFPVRYIMAKSQYEPGWIEGVVFLFPLFVLFISISLLFPINIIGFLILVVVTEPVHNITLYESFEKSGIPKEHFEIFYGLCDYNKHRRADRHTLEETCRIFSEDTPSPEIPTALVRPLSRKDRRAGLSIIEWNSLNGKSRALAIKLFFLRMKIVRKFNEEEKREKKEERDERARIKREEINRNEIMDEEDGTLFSVPLISKVLTCRHCGTKFYGKGVAGRVVKGTAGTVGMGWLGSFIGVAFFGPLGALGGLLIGGAGGASIGGSQYDNVCSDCWND